MVLPKERHVTYADYASWGEDTRCEVLDGVVISYNFSPSVNHQVVLGNLHHLFKKHFDGRSCDVFMAPLDVYLFADDKGPHEETDHWVEPDLFVLCDEQTRGERGIYGAPNLIIEILSPSNPKNDKVYKLNKYEQAGVEEYWIVDPFYKMVDVYLLREETLQLAPSLGIEDAVTSDLFQHLSVELKQVFTE